LLLDLKGSRRCFIVQSSEARNLGVEYYPHFDSTNFLSGLDVLVLSVPMVDFQEVVRTLPPELLAGKLIVDVCPLKEHPKTVMLKAFANYPDIDILCTNPMFGPISNSEESASKMNDSFDGRPLVYERVRVSDMQRCDRYLKFFEESRCQVVEMDSEQHDSSTADAEFVTHMIGRLLDHNLLPPTPVMSKEYTALSEVADLTSGDSFDLFFGMFKYNERAKKYMAAMRENLADIERQLAAREAYLAAKAEMKNSDRERLLAETRLLLREIAQSGIIFPSSPGVPSSLGALEAVVEPRPEDQND
jgi:arogenate dehydrogenase (NADP+)